MKRLVSEAVLLGAVGLAVAAAGHAFAQAGGQVPCPIGSTTPCAVAPPSTGKRGSPPSQSPDTPTLNGNGADDAMRDRTERMAEEQEKVRNSDRQKRLVADTDKLVALANQLKLDVDKTDKNTMSLDVIRKADEIEKLAHSVKDRMKGT